jgi:hypothetical protein
MQSEPGTVHKLNKNGEYKTIIFESALNPDPDNPAPDQSLEINVPAEHLHTLEAYLGIPHSIDGIINDQIETLNTLQIREARKMIDKIQDKEEKAKYFRKLQYKVKNINQRELDHPKRDKMCNLSVLAQTFILNGVENPNEDKQFPDALEDIRSQEFPVDKRTSSDAWKKLAKKFGLKIKGESVDDPIERNAFEEKFRPYLEKGNGVMLSIRYKKPMITVNEKGKTEYNYGGHIIRLVGITDEGIYVDDPYGKEDPLKRYNYPEDKEGYWINYNKTKDDASGTIDYGHQNLLSWDDLEQMTLTYGIIVY